jgi:hypothetical protein
VLLLVGTEILGDAMATELETDSLGDELREVVGDLIDGVSLVGWESDPAAIAALDVSDLLASIADQYEYTTETETISNSFASPVFVADADAEEQCHQYACRVVAA